MRSFRTLQMPPNKSLKARIVPFKWFRLAHYGLNGQFGTSGSRFAFRETRRLRGAPL